jgi:hypothetical protein
MYPNRVRISASIVTPPKRTSPSSASSTPMTIRIAGLPGTVRADEPERLPGLDRERQPVEGGQISEPAGQAVDLEHRYSFSGRASWPVPIG